MLDKQKILDAALEGVQRYVEQYNAENAAFVAVGPLDHVMESDHGGIAIDGGDIHGAWFLGLAEL